MNYLDTETINSYSEQKEVVTMLKGKERVLEQHVQRTSYVRKLPLMEKACPVCQQTFWGAKVKRYCSRACQNKANYGRHAEEYRENRVEKYQAEKKTAGKK